MRGKHFCRQKKTKLSTIYQILGYSLVMTFVILLLVIQGTSFSSYKDTVSGSDSARVAKPVLTFSDPKYETEVSAGEEATVDFTVSNGDQNQYSETALTYEIKIANLFSKEEGNIVYTLYESTDSGTTYTQVANDKTDPLTYLPTEPLPAGEQKTHCFRLKYTPSLKEENNKLSFTIRVEAKQVI